jgi:hypothetical protein
MFNMHKKFKIAEKMNSCQKTMDKFGRCCFHMSIIHNFFKLNKKRIVHYCPYNFLGENLGKQKTIKWD